MTARHTPGPWRAVPDPVDGRDYEVLVVCGMGMAETWIARTEYNWKEAGPRERRISFVEAQANARLIAAAPQLLEALQEAVAQYGKPGGPWNVPSDPGGWIARAKDALAAAGLKGPAA